MPTRLADGLGPESDPADGSPPAFAPSALFRGFGSPALTCRKARQLRLLTNGYYLSGAGCQMAKSQVIQNQVNIIVSATARPRLQCSRLSRASHSPPCLVAYGEIDNWYNQKPKPPAPDTHDGAYLSPGRALRRDAQIFSYRQGMWVGDG